MKFINLVLDCVFAFCEYIIICILFGLFAHNTYYYHTHMFASKRENHIVIKRVDIDKLEKDIITYNSTPTIYRHTTTQTTPHHRRQSRSGYDVVP